MMNTTQILTIGAVIIVAAAAVAVIVVNNGKDSGTSNVDPMDASWEDIVKDAKGQKITMGFYVADPMVAVWYPKFQKEMKDNYGIEVTAKSYGPAAAKTAVAEMEEGQMENGTFDFIWGDTSAYAAMINSKGDYSFVYDDKKDGKSWASILPNAYYLKSNSEQMISSMFKDYVPGSAVNFSNGQTMMVYNKDFNVDTVTVNDVTVKMPYNAAVLYDGSGNVTGFIKVGDSGQGSTEGHIIDVASVTSQSAFDTAFAGADTVSVDAARAEMDVDHGQVKGYMKYAIPTNFNDLSKWVQIYPKQFGYPDPANTAAVFHTNLLTQAMIYELTWADSSAKTGWKVAENKEANVTAVNTALANVKSNDDYKAAFGYVFNYLKALDPYVHQWSGAAKYQDTGTIVDYNAKIVGNQSTDKDFSDDTIMLAMSTVTSIDSRVGEGKQYSYNAGAFSFDTGCSSDYYIFIPQNSSHKTAAMVVINALLDPAEQVDWFATTGNGFNIDTSKNVIGGTETVNDKYFKSVLENMSIYLPPERLAEVTQVAMLTGYVGYFTPNWTSEVKA